MRGKAGLGGKNESVEPGARTEIAGECEKRGAHRQAGEGEGWVFYSAAPCSFENQQAQVLRHLVCTARRVSADGQG